MAKNKKVSVHSRAARRAASPSINLDKSITSIKAPTDAVDYNPKTLGVQDAGISKKTKQKPMTRAQRLRREKGLERGDKNLDILEVKTAKSKARGRKVDDRRATWDELNTKVKTGALPKSSKPSKPVDEEDDMSEDDAPARKSVFSAYMPADEEENDDSILQADSSVQQADSSTIHNADEDDIL